MAPIIGRYGPFFLYSYTVVLGLGVLCGLALVAWQRPRPGWADTLLFSLTIGLIGARAGFVLTNTAYYTTNTAEIAQFSQGGLSYHAGFLSACLASIGWCWWHKQNWAELAGLVAPSLTLAHAFGWLACYLEGCAYGQATFIGWLAADLPDSLGVFAVRYQTQLFGVLLSLLVFGLVWFGRTRLRPGHLFALTLFLISTGRVLISPLRDDPTLFINTLRLDTLLDASLMIISLIYGVLIYHSATIPNQSIS